MASAQNLVGLMHQDGKGAPLDRKQAEAWFRKAAVQGDLKGQSNLGHLLYNQPGDRPEKIEALMWLVVAKQRGEVLATRTLALIESTVPKDDMTEARQQARERATANKPPSP